MFYELLLMNTKQDILKKVHFNKNKNFIQLTAINLGDVCKRNKNTVYTTLAVMLFYLVTSLLKNCFNKVSFWKVVNKMQMCKTNNSVSLCILMSFKIGFCCVYYWEMSCFLSILQKPSGNKNDSYKHSSQCLVLCFTED